MRESRARLVAATDAERRRIERNLHDGAQQTLLGPRLAIRLARNRGDGDEALLDAQLAEIDPPIAALVAQGPSKDLTAAKHDVVALLQRIAAQVARETR